MYTKLKDLIYIFLLKPGIEIKKPVINEKKNGYEARILQHEIDHLSGKLFIDYLSSLKRNIIIKKVKKLKKIGEI